MSACDQPIRQRMEVRGVVQGVGFRPFVFGLAKKLALSGFVRNHSSGVTIEVEGLPESLRQFAAQLRQHAPPQSQIDKIVTVEIRVAHELDFQIILSETAPAASTPISPDIATCRQCLAEFGDPQNRRYRYPFINCTHCGPRYTIIRDVPYDRPNTTMSVFPLCRACQREYHDPGNRRFHAQPNACPDCGPAIWFVAQSSTEEPRAFQAMGDVRGEAALVAFHHAIGLGQIVAVKGIGGFHLACDANHSAAIDILRQRKGRSEKPLAIMVKDLAAAQRFAFVDPDEASLLAGCQRPIVLLRRRPDCELPDSVAPGNKYLGVMFPYSALHELLLERGPLIMTSGNLSEEPIARTNDEAFERLRGIADAFLLHNREIHVVCDDSVVRVHRGWELPIRRSRGYAPLPVRLNNAGPNVLAVGGELKATFCVTKEDYAFLSPHIGDMGNLQTLEALRRGIDHFRKLFRVVPSVVACDRHPGYLSRHWALKYAADHGLKVVEVQHHHAHVAALLAEHQFERDQNVIGVCFDGTGYGGDCAIWGGEVLLANCREFRRWAHLEYVALPGGDAAVKHPYRVGLAQLQAANESWDERIPCVAHCSPSERAILKRQLQRNINCVPTSSMGRLFDSVAAITGVRQSVSYEAQAALEMEALADDARNVRPYPFSVLPTIPHIVSASPMIAEITGDVIGKVPRSAIIARFHRTVAQMILELCLLAREQEHLNVVALTGGVFQNVLLAGLAADLLLQAGIEVISHRAVPPNDAGLSLGQAVVAMSQTDLA